jgi:hypothetical protein
MAKASASQFEFDVASLARRLPRLSAAQPLEQFARKRHSRRVRRPPLAQAPDQLTLPFGRDLTVVQFGGLDRGVAEVLAERLVILERDADRLPVARQRMPEGMRIEIGNARGLECLAEDRSDRR